MLLSLEVVVNFEMCGRVVLRGRTGSGHGEVYMVLYECFELGLVVRSKLA